MYVGIFMKIEDLWLIEIPDMLIKPSETEVIIFTWR